MASLGAAGAAVSASSVPAVLEWGMDAIRLIQGNRPEALTAAAETVTNLGSPAAYIVLTAFFYWCVDERKAFRAGLVLFLSNGVNGALKTAFRVPRPFILDPTINLIGETGYSLPSGHSQNAAAFWPSLLLGAGRGALGRSPAASGESRKIAAGSAALAALALPLLIGMSRVYLGVHYPTDVLLGWLLGGIIAASAIKAEPFVRRLAANAPAASSKTLPYALAAGGAVLLNALGGSDGSMGGVFFGFASGKAWLDSMEGKAGRFSAAEGTPLRKGARLVLGLAVLAGLYLGLKALFPGPAAPSAALFRFVRYGACGFWAAGLAPFIFLKSGLSRSGR